MTKEELDIVMKREKAYSEALHAMLNLTNALTDERNYTKLM